MSFIIFHTWRLIKHGNIKAHDFPYTYTWAKIYLMFYSTGASLSGKQEGKLNMGYNTLALKWDIMVVVIKLFPGQTVWSYLARRHVCWCSSPRCHASLYLGLGLHLGQSLLRNHQQLSTLAAYKHHPWTKPGNTRDNLNIIIHSRENWSGEVALKKPKLS